MIGAVGLVRQRLADAAPYLGDRGEEADGDFLEVIEAHKVRFLAAMDDDLNAPQALAALFDLNREVNTLLNSGQIVTGGTLAAIDGAYRALGGDVLGVIPGELPQEGGEAGLDAALMDVLIDLRAAARKNKDWATADTIRDRLAEAGVALEDRAEGTTWRVEK